MNSRNFNSIHRKSSGLPNKQLAIIGFIGIVVVTYVGLLHSNNGSHQVKSSNVSEITEVNVNLAKIVEEEVFCGENIKVLDKQANDSLPVIYFVTPTYARSVQIAELTRLGQTLAIVPSLHWVLVEDASECSPIVARLLNRLKISYTHLASAMPHAFKKLKAKPRGVSNRRAALRWIRSNVQQGVLYFGDDDNTYDLRLFDEIRDTGNVSVFPVGLIGDYAISAPIVRDGQVIGFYDSWPAGRQFPIDMAGFAVNLQLLHQHPNATMNYKAGFEEDGFLRGLEINASHLEPKASNCTEILVWHTRTVQVPVKTLKYPSNGVNATSAAVLFQRLERLKVASFSPKDGKSSSIVPFETKAKNPM